MKVLLDGAKISEKTSSFQKELETVQRDKELIGRANQALHEEVNTINQRSERQKDEISMLEENSRNYRMLLNLKNAIEIDSKKS